MLQAHSPLWHYLWVAPNVFLLVLALLAWRRGLQKQFPIFVIFAVVAAIEQLTVYVADILPSVTAATWWQIFWVGLLIEAFLKFALVGEIFSQVFGPYSSIAKLGKLLISGAGVVLILVAAVAAAYTPKNSTHSIVSGVHIFEQTIYMVESGLILFLFVFAAYFKLSWNRSPFGIALGLGMSACVHLATWTLMANGKFSPRHDISLIFVNMATYHACVLLWFYYLLVPHKAAQKSEALVPEHNLELWNRELERLLHQ
ncbi:MAG: hypothetical protein ABSF15_05570 [Candidatus Sulfotelmatobacter sp.]|jgi:hypothetical protein